MNTVNAVLVVIGAAAAVAFVLVYGLSAAWWRNPIGRYLILQGVVIALVYVPAVIRLVTSHWVPARPVTVTSLIVNIIAAVVETTGAASFAIVIRQGRRLTQHLAAASTDDLAPKTQP